MHTPTAALKILVDFLNRSDLSVKLIDQVFEDVSLRDPGGNIARNLLQQRHDSGNFSTKKSILATKYIGEKTYAVMLKKAMEGALDRVPNRGSDAPSDNESNVIEEGIIMKELFTSDGWVTEKISNERNCHFVKLQHPEKQAQFEFSFESGRGADYKAAANYTFQLNQEQAEILSPWLHQINKAYTDAGLKERSSIKPGTALTMSFDIDSAPDSGRFSALVDLRLGDTLAGQLEASGLNKSVEVSARGDGLPLFLTPQASDTARKKVNSINLHRDPRDGNVEAIASSLDSKNQIHAEGLSINRKGPPCGGATVPLYFPSGLLSIPVDSTIMRLVTALSEEILQTLESAILTSMGGIILASNGKHKCVRHIIRLMGATAICALGIYGTLAGTVITEGVLTPALAVAIAVCFGSKALTVTDMILAHLGWA